MTTSLNQPSFSKGEISTSLTARTDLEAYMTALKKCRNFMVSPYGGVLNRPGFEFVAQTEGNEVARMIRFKFSSSDTYALEFTHLKMRVYRNGGLVLSGMSPFVSRLAMVDPPTALLIIGMSLPIVENASRAAFSCLPRTVLDPNVSNVVDDPTVTR